MALSYVEYTGNGTQTAFAIPFPFISRNHVEVYVNGVQVTTGFSVSGATLTFTTAPANGAALVIRRNSSRNSRLVNFTTGNITPSNLNRDSLQAFYLIQEAMETTTAPAPPPGPPQEALSVTMLTPENVTSSSATLRMAITGTIPANSQMLIQWSTSLAGPWLESPRPVAVNGVFSHPIPSGLTAGTTYFTRGFVFTDNGGTGDVIHAVTPIQSFQTSAVSGPTGVLTLQQAYATAMTEVNDFPPGNSGGQASFENSTWPMSSYFPSSPYGANVDPIRFGQAEPGVGTTDSGYIVQRRAASSRVGDRFGLWQWIMPPKGYLNALGNWRVQVRDVQAALKIDALTNPWRSKFSGQIRTYGQNGANPLMISGLLDNFSNSNGRGLFTSTNLVNGRTEATGGISFQNFGHTTDDFQVELNSNDPLVTLAADETPSRVIAFAAVYWARIIPDTGPGPIPTGLQFGAMHGVDFFDANGRVGTPGQSRLIRLDENWRPCFVGYVLQGPAPSQPMTPASAGAWLAANPPPFV